MCIVSCIPFPQRRSLGEAERVCLVCCSSCCVHRRRITRFCFVYKSPAPRCAHMAMYIECMSRAHSRVCMALPERSPRPKKTPALANKAVNFAGIRTCLDRQVKCANLIITEAEGTYQVYYTFACKYIELYITIMHSPHHIFALEIGFRVARRMQRIHTHTHKKRAAASRRAIL